MQSLAAFFDDNKPLAIGAAVAVVLVLAIILFILYRLLFGRRLRTAAGGRARQPRLGIVDAYDLDRQRQLVLVRRDNVEHLIMIGGPTDVVIESAIVRTQMPASARDKDGMGPMVGTPPAPALAAPQPPALASAPPSPGSAPPLPARTEPSLGMPMPPPPAPADRGPRLQPESLPQAPSAPDAIPPLRTGGQAPPRPSSLPPRPAQASPPPGASNPNGSAPAGAVPSRPPVPARPAPRPPLPPLPPRPSLASTLPPRPARPLPSRAEPAARPDAPAAPIDLAQPPAGAEPESRIARGPAEPTPAPTPAPPKSIETLESLEEEMAKLLGRPTQRRDS